MSNMRIRRILDVILLAAVVLGGVYIVQHRQQIYDFARIYNYQPPAAVSQLATDTTMTALGKNAFYVNHPELLSDKAKFNEKCNQREQTIVLGCYYSKQRGIYIYEVTDERLAGIKEVTAAHEMLHAAYDRLGKEERENLGKILQDYFDKTLKDERIINTINSYKNGDEHSHDLVNEMHSIFGTEIADLPPALEKHYERFFKDRSKVVAYSAKYEGEFTSRRNTVAAYDAQLAALRQQITAAEASLEQKERALTQQKAQLDADRAAGRIEAYNAAVPGFNAQVSAYNSQVAALRALIAQHNDIVEKRNAIALEEQQLVEAISSSTTPVQAQ